MEQSYLFQELPWDMRQMVFEGVRVLIDAGDLQGAIEKYGLDKLLNEEADDIINRYNWRRSPKEWLAFAETGM